MYCKTILIKYHTFLKTLKFNDEKFNSILAEDSVDAFINTLGLDNSEKNDEALKEQVIYLVCSSYHVSLENLKSKKRFRELVLSRQLIMTVLDRLTSYSLKEIANNFGQDHSTVDHSRKTINILYDNYIDYKIYINALYTAIGTDTELIIKPPPLNCGNLPTYKADNVFNKIKDDQVFIKPQKNPYKAKHLEEVHYIMKSF
jgi:hypothetical protein